MNIESQVCSLELSKKLFELRVKQDSFFYHVKNECFKFPIFFENEQEKVDYMNKYKISIKPFAHAGNEDSFFSAFTVAELGEMLIEADFRKNIELDYYTTDVFNVVLKQNKVINFDPIYIKDKSEANCRAKMLIHLIENKLIEV